MTIFTKKFNPKKFIVLWLPVIIWAGIIFSFSSLSTNKVGAPFHLGDFLFKKTAHLVEYATLSILIFRALYQTFGKQNLKNYNWTTFVICFLYAISDEYHQSFVYGRTPTVRDVVIDSIGILLALHLIKVVKNNNKFKIVKKIIFG